MLSRASLGAFGTNSLLIIDENTSRASDLLEEGQTFEQ